MSETVEFQNELKRLLRSGFYSLEEAHELACEIVDFSGPDIQADILSQRVYDKILLEQKQWSGPSDCDRLIQAFEVLRSNGVVCCENFSCCGNCGSHEVWEVIEVAQSMGREIQGYVFYHQQDTDNAVEGHGLYFNYGSVDGASETIAAQLVAELQKAGLSPTWNGSLSTRVFVPLEWKRRMWGT